MFTPKGSLGSLDGLAQLVTHIPNKGEQMVRYYGYYSNKSRGMRKKAGSDDQVPALVEKESFDRDHQETIGADREGTGDYLKTWHKDRVTALWRRLRPRKDATRGMGSGNGSSLTPQAIC